MKDKNMNKNGFITKYGYMSINRHWFDNTHQKVIVLEGSQYNIDQLRKVISYKDNRKFYRWRPDAFNKAFVGIV